MADQSNNNGGLNQPTTPSSPQSNQGNFGNIPQELALNRQKYQDQRANNIVDFAQEKTARKPVIEPQKNNLENTNQDPSRYEVDWGGAGESTNEAPKQQAQELEKRKSQAGAEKAAQVGGKTMETTGQAAKIGGKGAKTAGGAVGNVAGKGIGAGIGAVGGAVTGALAGGVGAIPGALTGAKAGATAGQRVGGKVGKKVGQAPGQALEQTGKGLERGGKTLKDAGRQASLINRRKQQSLKNLKSKKLPQNLDNVAKLASKQTSAGILSSMWAAVWFDWTFLTLISLHGYLFASLFTDKIAQFGEDKFGKLFPDKQLAKYIEIIILFIIDGVVLAIILMIGYIGYRIYDLGWGAWVKAGIAWLLPGGKTGTGSVLDSVTK